jgi:hypothetical protein
MAAQDDANELKGILGEIQKEMKGFFNYSKSSKDSLYGLVSAAEQFNNAQREGTELSAEQLRNISEKIRKEKENLSTLQSSLKTEIEIDKVLLKSNQDKSKGLEDQIKKLSQKRRLNEKERNVLSELKSQQSSINSEVSNLTKQIDENTEAFERGRAVLEDMDGSISKLEKGLRKATNAANFKEGFEKVKDTLSSISTPLDGMLKPMNLINNAIGFVVGGVQELDKELGDTAKSMNMTYTEAGKSKLAMVEFAKSSEIPLANAVNLNKQVTELNKSLGSSVAFENMGKSLQEDVALMGELGAKAGYTAEETNSMLKYTMATGQSAKDVMKTGLATAKVEGMKRGVLLNQKEIMKDIAKASEAVKLSVSGGGAGLVKAAAAAKALGTDLATVDKIAGSILNFEQSIESELQAELLTGKQLNLETARQAALNGDLATVADEVAKNIGSAADFQNMNRVAAEALAQSVGMTKDELAKTLVEQEALKNIGEASMEDARAKYDTLVAEKGEAIALKELGDEALAKQFQQMSLDEKRAEAQKVMQDMLAEDVVPTMAHISQIFEKVFNTIKNIISSLGGMKVLLIAIGAIIAAKLAMGMVQFGKGALDAIKFVSQLASKERLAAIGSIVKGAWSSLGSIPYVGPALAGAAIGAGVGYLASVMTGDDIMSPGGGSGYGKRTLFGPEGAIQLNDKDTVIAGTNLFGNDVRSEPGKGTEFAGKGEIKIGGGGGPDMSGLVNAINGLRSDVNALASRPINVSVDGKKIIEATTGANPNEDGDAMRKNSYKVQ